MKIEKIWAELSAKAQEVELSEEQKVELGLVEDFEKVYQAAIKQEESIALAIINALEKGESKYKSLISDLERAIKIGNDAEVAAKDLGVDLPSVFQNKVETARRSIKEAQGLLSKISQMYSAF